MRSIFLILFLSAFYLTGNGQSKGNKCPANCQELKNIYSMQQVKEMHDEVNEASGLEKGAGKYLWTHGDGGTGTTLFKLSPDGNLLEKIKLDNVKNKDWEDLARDRKGNLYIGDFGNNKSERKDLQIIKIRESNPKGKTEAIKFSFQDQKSFPPAEGKPGFDCEAFFWHNGNLYLFNKNASCRDYVRVYQLPDKPGTYTARLVDSIRINSTISSADLSPDGKTVALLGYEELYLFEMNGKGRFSNGQVKCLKLAGIGKTEGITFRNNTDMVVCNENGMLYRVTKPAVTAKGKSKGKKN